MAYVADGGNGIQVVNYLSADLLENPPEITLAANFPLDPTAEVQAGSLARITADVTDDIQVSHVEFYIGGELAASDGDFPFEHRFIAPLFDTQFFFTLQAKVVDTGGNETWTDEITVNILEDTTRPRIASVSPIGGKSMVDTVLVRFTEPMDPSTFNSVRFFVRQINDGTGYPLKGIGEIIPDGVFTYREGSNTAILKYPTPLAKGLYEIVVINSVADLSGNRLRDTFHSSFFVGDAVFWTRAGEGNWDVGANWSAFNVPSASDTAIASLPEKATIVIDSEQTVANFYTDHFVDMTRSGGRLTVNGPFVLNNRLDMNFGATLANADISMGPDGAIRFFRNQFTTSANLDGLTVGGAMDFIDSGASANVRNNLTLNGIVRLRGGGGTSSNSMIFRDTDQILDGTGAVQFLSQDSASSIGASGNATSFTVGPEITVQGPGEGTVNLGAAGQMRGTVDSSAGGIHLRGETWTNEGLLHSHGVGEILLDDDWSNNGEIILEETGTLVFGGEFTPSDIGDFTRNGGGVVLTGDVDLTSEPLILDASTGSWEFLGTIMNGTVETREGTQLTAGGNTNISGAGSVFDNATLNGKLSIGSSKNVQVFNDLTLNGLITFSGGTGSSLGGVRFQDASNTLDGTGTIQFLRNPSSNFVGAFTPNSFVVGPEITFKGPGQGTVQLGAGGTMQGTVDASSGRIRLSGESWTNEGFLHSYGVGEMTLAGAWTNNSQIIVEETGTLILDGDWD
ncbi:MAG: Ig-like domain-containing protein, partial [Candidatus Omnitrophica bacterium]|nr:Ig-like domain-containing protein [Candidatus Omnitrophota bacterium]